MYRSCVINIAIIIKIRRRRKRRRRWKRGRRRRRRRRRIAFAPCRCGFYGAVLLVRLAQWSISISDLWYPCDLLGHHRLNPVGHFILKTTDQSLCRHNYQLLSFWFYLLYISQTLYHWATAVSCQSKPLYWLKYSIRSQGTITVWGLHVLNGHLAVLSWISPSGGQLTCVGVDLRFSGTLRSWS